MAYKHHMIHKYNINSSHYFYLQNIGIGLQIGQSRGITSQDVRLIFFFKLIRFCIDFIISIIVLFG